MLLSRLPLGLLRPLGRAAGTLAWWLARPRRRIALINLALCFPQWSAAQRRQVAHEHFQWFMCSVLERFIFWNGSAERIRRLVRIEHLERFERLRGRPLILLAPHFVGIDAGGMRLSLDGTLMTMFAHQTNPVLDAAMIAGRSRFPGALPLARQEGVRATVRLMRQGVPFHYSPDMDLGGRESVFVPFFGIPAATITGMARLAALSGATVLPWVTRMTREGYVGEFLEPWAADPDEDPQAAARRLNAFVESQVLRMPAQYLWTHRRFKTRPPGERSPYARPER
jgi:KDO2-lipid IV(A) lauroyltransferase